MRKYFEIYQLYIGNEKNRAVAKRAGVAKTLLNIHTWAFLFTAIRCVSLDQVAVYSPAKSLSACFAHLYIRLLNIGGILCVA